MQIFYTNRTLSLVKKLTFALFFKVQKWHKKNETSEMGLQHCSVHPENLAWKNWLGSVSNFG